MKTDKEEQMEEWRDIKDYEGLYQVSNLGRVKSLSYRQTGQERILKLKNNKKNNYLCIGICRNGKVKQKLVHRLVAEAFLEDYSENLEVDHVDTNPHNNNIENLKMVTSKENSNNPLTLKHYSEANKGKNNPMCKHLLKEAEQKINKNYTKFNIENNSQVREVICIETGKVYPTIAQASKELKLYASHISAVCKGKRKTTGGLHFKYLEEFKEYE